MGFAIEDGTGSGNTAEVKNNKLLVSGVFSTQEHFANHNTGRGYNLSFEVTPDSTSKCVIYIQNTDTEYAMSLEGIWLRCETDEIFDINLRNVGMPTNANEIIPINLNTMSARKANGLFYSGADIGGLTTGQNAFRIYHSGAYESIYRNFDMDIILGSNGILTIYCENGLSQVSGIISFNFHGTNN